MARFGIDFAKSLFAPESKNRIKLLFGSQFALYLSIIFYCEFLLGVFGILYTTMLLITIIRLLLNFFTFRWKEAENVLGTLFLTLTLFFLSGIVLRHAFP